MLNSSSEKTIAKLLYLGVPAVSLLVTGFMSYDPVNVGKMVITVGIGFSIWALVLKNNFGTSFRYQKSVFLAVAFFIVAGVSSTLASDAPLEQNIFGVHRDFLSNAISTVKRIRGDCFLILSLEIFGKRIGKKYKKIS